MGAALAGGIGVGMFSDFSLAEALTPIVDTVLPTPELKLVYDRMYNIFNKAYEAFVPLYEAMVE